MVNLNNDGTMIPKVINFVWISRIGKSLTSVENFVDLWVDMYPDYIVKIWNDADIRPFLIRNPVCLRVSMY